MMSKELGNEFSVVSTNNQSEVLLPNSPIYTGKFGYVRFAQFGPICTTVQLYNGTIVPFLLKVTVLDGCILHFLNCRNGSKSRKACHIKFHSKRSGMRDCNLLL